MACKFAARGLYLTHVGQRNVFELKRATGPEGVFHGLIPWSGRHIFAEGAIGVDDTWAQRETHPQSDGFTHLRVEFECDLR